MKAIAIVAILFGLLGLVIGDCSQCASTNLCCQDEVIGPTCYDPTTDSCVDGVRLCGLGEAECNGVCYDPTAYSCVGGTITQGASATPTPTPASTPAPGACGNAVCGSGDLCCVDEVLGPVCYDPTGYQCVNGVKLCGEGEGECNGVCFDSSQYFCNNSGEISPTPPPSQCAAADDAYILTCDYPTGCCGAETMDAQCANNDVKCCQWYLAATTCALDEACCGSLGYGASSFAFCCTAGTYCCQNGDAYNTCCLPGEVCCGSYGGESWCCPSGEVCGNSYGGCNA